MVLNPDMPEVNNSVTRPLVSVLLATRNEEAFIERTLASLLQQKCSGFDLEILVIDGLSTDSTLRRIAEVAGRDPRVRVINNSDREIPFAWNLGVKAAAGEYVCTLGAHCVYEPQYISVCLAELGANGAVGCGGRAITQCAKGSVQARLCGWILGHPFGCSTRSFRTQPEGFVDSPAYPVFLKGAIVRAGGFDENLHRNEDNDMSRKLRADGGKLYCTWKTRCYYFGKSRLPDLFRYAFRNGLWNAIGLGKNLRMMSLRHFVPFGFILTLVLLALASLVPSPLASGACIGLLGLVALHMSGGFLAGLHIAVKERRWEALSLPLFFLIFHMAYGTGTCWGFAKVMTKMARGQPGNIRREPAA